MSNMKVWSVQIRGEGFLRQNSRMSFELSGFIEAADPNDAFTKAVSLGKKQYPELNQAEKQESPRPAINGEEIVEFVNAPRSEINKVEIHWASERNI